MRSAASRRLPVDLLPAIALLIGVVGCNGGGSSAGSAGDSGADTSSGSSSGSGSGGSSGSSSGSSSGGSSGGGDGGPSDAGSGCSTNPTTYLEIINACTDAAFVDLHPTLPLLQPDGSLPPLP